MYETAMVLIHSCREFYRFMSRLHGNGSKTILIVFGMVRSCVYTGPEVSAYFWSAIRTLLGPLTKVDPIGSEHFSAPCRRADRIRRGADRKRGQISL